MTASQPSRDSAEPQLSVPRRDHHVSLPAEIQRILFEQSREAILVAGSDGRYVDANSAALSLLGYERDEVLRLHFTDVVPPGPSWNTETYARFVREGHWEGEVDVRTKDGVLVPTEARTVVLDGAHDGVLITMFRDLSDRNTNEVTRARLAALVSSSADAIISETLDGIITDWNPAAECLYGYTAQEAIGRHLSMLMPADRASELDAFLARVRTGESVEGIETIRRTKDNRLIDIALTVFPIYNDAKQIIGASSINRDITERKAAAHALAAAHQRTREVLESITDGFFALDANWRIIDVNSAAERMLGITRDKARGMTISQEPAPAMTAPLYAALIQAMAERRPVTAEGYYLPVDGWLEVRAYPSPEGLSVFFRDVTERKHLEDDLRASEAKYRTLVEQLPAVVYVLAADQQQTGVYYSPKLETLMNLRPGDAMTRTGHWLDMVHPDDRARVAAEGARATDSGEPYRLEYRYVRSDGSIIWVRDECVPVHNESGRIVAWQGLLLDITERVHAEQALAASEIRFRTAFANAPIGMTLVSPDGRILQANAAICAMLGYSESELLNMRFQEFTYPDDLEPNLALTRSALAGERDTYELEKRYFRKDGQLVWAHLHASLVRDEDGAPFYLIAQVQDITTRKATEEALAASVTRFRTAFENAPIGMALTSAEQGVLQVNRALCAMLGYGEAELMTKTLRGLTHPDDIPANRALVERALAGDFDIFELEKRYIRKDGQIVWAHLRVSLVRDDSGTPLYFISQTQDITERKAAEAELAAAHHTTQEVLQRITDGFYALDRDWCFTYLNDAAERMLGRTRDEVLGKNVWEAFAPAVDTPLHAAYHEAIETGKTTSVEFFYPPLESWFEVRAYPAADGLSVFFRDITEHKRSDEELRAALNAAQAAIRARSQFLAMMSHELRTPMQAVLGYADLLLAGPDGSLSSEQTEDIHTIRLGAERMIALVNQMLDLSRLDAGRLELSLQPVDMAEIIEQVRQDIAPQAASKGLTLRIELPAELPLVTGDAVRLRQILLNLVGNAVKFTDQGSVGITAGMTDTELDVAVRDTGIGIETEALRHIFEEFRQADSGMARRYAGAGLGLAIAKKLAEQHGGRISVSSQPRVGSTFTLHLPLHQRFIESPSA